MRLRLLYSRSPPEKSARESASAKKQKCAGPRLMVRFQRNWSESLSLQACSRYGYRHRVSINRSMRSKLSASENRGSATPFSLVGRIRLFARRAGIRACCLWAWHAFYRNRRISEVEACYHTGLPSLCSRKIENFFDTSARRSRRKR